MVMNTHPNFHGLCFNWKCLQEKGISTVCDLTQTSWAFCALRPCQWMHEANRNKGTPSAVYLCIHFMIWKELDFTKIGICSNTKNLCLEAQTSVVSYRMQRVEMMDSLKPERRWRHYPCPMTPPAAAGLVSSDIWSHCQGTLSPCRFWQRLVSPILCSWVTSEISVWASFGNIRGRMSLPNIRSFVSWGNFDASA